MKICKIYESILKSVGFIADKDGLISRLNAADVMMPVMLRDENDARVRLALPTGDRLRSGDWTGLTAFAPLSENIVLGESEVITLLRKAMRNRVTVVLGMLIEELTRIAVDTDKHKELSPRQHELTSVLSNADKRTLKDFTSILENVNGTSRSLVKLFLKRGGKIDGEVYDRAFIMSFPVEADEDRNIFKVSLRVKDVPMFDKLMDYILPGYKTQAFCTGSKSKKAPYLMAALSGYAKVIARLNEVVKEFSDRIEGADEFITDIPWVSELPTLLEHIHDIPPLRGNTGKSSSDDEDPENAPTETSVSPKPRVKMNVEDVDIRIGEEAKPTASNNTVAATAPAKGTVELSAVLGQGTVPTQAIQQNNTLYDIHGNPVSVMQQVPMAGQYHGSPTLPQASTSGHVFQPPMQQPMQPAQQPLMSPRERSDARARMPAMNQGYLGYNTGNNQYI